MTEQRYGYTYHRVLVDSARVLDPQFEDAVIYVTGAQLELLRNMTQYLNRLSTYVSEYHPGYYLSPTIEDYDSICAIVADLENVIMGNPNTIWGYQERLTLSDVDNSSAGYDLWIVPGTVPAGEVWVLEDAYAHHHAGGDIDLHMYIGNTGVLYYLDRFYTASPVIDHRWAGRLVLSEGDQVVCRFTEPGDNIECEFSIWGYKMVVPES